MECQAIGFPHRENHLPHPTLPDGVPSERCRRLTRELTIIQLPILGAKASIEGLNVPLGSISLVMALAGMSGLFT
jgi:hypothetical protein